MLKSRIIPVLLIRDKGLVKTLGFKPDKYVGDPINAVRIYNEKQVDELTVLDIDATAQGREPDYKMIENLASECRMPLCYGGGIKTPEQAAHIISLGVEKVSLSSAFIQQPDLIPAFAERIGAQSVVLTMDILKVKKLLRTSYQVTTHNAANKHDIDIAAFLKRAEQLGVGEIVINAVDRDGQMKGYDLDLAKLARDATSGPLTMLGGAGSRADMQALIDAIGTCGAAAGSLFVYRGNYKAVLINYDRPARL
jgi:imidazole glycerol-phosphate synthase subunit HisF